MWLVPLGEGIGKFKNGRNFRLDCAATNQTAATNPTKVNRGSECFRDSYIDPPVDPAPPKEVALGVIFTVLVGKS